MKKILDELSSIKELEASRVKNYVVIIIIIHELLFLYREGKEKAFEVRAGRLVPRVNQTIKTA